MIKNSFTLLEAIFAIFILTVAIGGSFALINYVLSFTPLTQSKLTASYLAQEGIEIIRNIRDTNWLQGTGSWDQGLTISGTGPSQCADVNGCVVDYTYTTQADPDLPAYADQYLNIDSTGFYSYSTTPPYAQTKFKRQVIVSPLSADSLNVSVFVYWQEKGQNYQIHVQENLYNWR